MRIWLNNLWQQCLITADEAKTRSVRALGSPSQSLRLTSPLQLDHLEPRILFSATPIDPAMMEGGDEAAMVATVELEESSDESEFHSDATTTLIEASPREIVIIDGGVDDIEQLLDDLNASDRNIEVFVLDSERDGIDQITEILDGRSDIDSLHIVSHGTDGQVKLGNVWLNDENLDGYAGQVASWQGSLSGDADILFYGCDLASDDAGRALVESLSALTGADVAASDDVTGHASLGGDWDLEITVGVIETDLAFGTELQQSWMGLLDTYTVTSTDGGGAAGTLKRAISDANGNPGLDIIDFNIAGGGPATITLVGNLGTITDEVIIDATTQPGYSGTPLITVDGDGAVATVFDVNDLTNMGVTIKGFHITGALGDAIVLTSDNNTIEANHIFGNGADGIHILNSSGNTIGGTTSAARNVISGNGDDGIEITGAGSTLNTIVGNYIGTDVTGTIAQGNTFNGIWINGGANNNTIGGNTNGAGNVISGNLSDGIDIEGIGTSNNQIYGNLIGVDASGMVELANGDHGIRIEDAAGTIIGGSAAGQGNVISGNNEDGINIAGSNATGTVIRGNFIGSDQSGTIDLGNGGWGVLVSNLSESFANIGAASNVMIGGGNPGEGNIIAFNNWDGVALWSSTGSSTGVTIRRNQFYQNGELAIDLGDNGVTNNDAGDGDGGANNHLNFPEITSATATATTITINGSVDTDIVSSPVTIDFYEVTAADEDGLNHGEATRYLDSLTLSTDPSGDISLVNETITAMIADGSLITATVTAPDGSTSEFSLNAAVQYVAPIVDLDANDSTSFGIDFDAVFTISGGPIKITDVDVVVQDDDSPTLTRVDITISDDQDGLNEVLDADVSGTSITKNWNNATHTLELIGPDSAFDFGRVLRTVTYDNTAPTPLGNSRTIQFVASDGTNDSIAAVVHVDINHANDAPLNQLPDDQVTVKDKPLEISNRNGNPILITDSDAAGGEVDVTLTVTNGTVTLSDVAGFESIGNAHTTGSQIAPSVASNDAGDFVVVWQSDDNQDGHNFGVFGQRYDKYGNLIGDEFQVNQTWNQTQNQPAVAMDAGGNFVVVWTSSNQDGDGSDGIYARMYDAAGNAVTDEFAVPDAGNRNFDQATPTIAMNASGQFVIAWDSVQADTKEDIFIKTFNADGTAATSGIRVHPTGWLGSQTEPSVGMDDSGNVVVAWTAQGQDTDGSVGVMARRYDFSGTPLASPTNPTGNPFLVNTYDAQTQDESSVSMNSSGDFVVAWTSSGQDGNNLGVYARQYGTDGDPASGEIAVNTETSNAQAAPAVALHEDGSFVVVWQSTNQAPDGSQEGVFAQRFDSGGVKDGAEFLVNTFTTQSQQRAAIAMDAAGDFVISWDSKGQDGGDANEGVYSQRYMQSDAITYLAGTGTNDTNVTIRGTLEYVNDVLDGMIFTPDAGFVGTATIEITTDDRGNSGPGGALTDTDTLAIHVQEYESLWLSTVGSGVGGGHPGWDSGDVLELSSPNLEFESGGTVGNLYDVFDLTTLVFSGDDQIDALHYVGHTITYPSFTLNPGDVLFSTTAGTTTFAAAFGGGTFDAKDLLVFRPTTPGDYTSGTVELVFDTSAITGFNNPDHVMGVTLVEVETDLPDDTLDAGSFLITIDNDVYYFAPDDLGAATAGEAFVMLTGTQIGIAAGWTIDAIDLIEWDTILGDEVLAAGTLLISLDAADLSVGNGVTTGLEEQDVIQLSINSTTMGGNPSNVDARKFLDGSDVGFTDFVPAEDINALSVLARDNIAPFNHVPGPQTTPLAPLTFDDAGSNRITVGDVDLGSNPIEITLTASNGTLSLSSTTGLSFSAGTGAGDTTMTFMGTLTSVNAALNGLVYTPVAPGAETITIISDDLGSMGMGGPKSDTDVINVTVTGASTPIGVISDSDAATSDSVLEDAAATTYVGITAQAIDPDGGDIVTYTLTDDAGGRFDIHLNSGVVTLVGAIDYEAATSHDITVRADSSDGSFSTKTFTVNIGNVNEPPTLTAAADDPTFIENGAAVGLFSGTSIDLIDTADKVMTLKLTVGTLQNGSDEILVVDGQNITLTAGVTVTTANSYNVNVSVAASVATVTITKAGDIAVVDAESLINTLQYLNNSDVPGTSRTVTITQIQDNGGGSDSTALGIASNVAITTSNDSPTLSATGDDPAFTENDAAVGLFSGTSIDLVETADKVKTIELTVGALQNGSDEILVVDGENITLTTGLTVTAANSYNVNVTVVASVATVTITKTGDIDVADAESLIDALQYLNNNDDPGTSRTVTITSIQDDGGGTDNSAPNINSTVSITNINDAPTLLATDVDPTFGEGGAAVNVFSGASIDLVEAADKVKTIELTVDVLQNGADELLWIDGQAIALLTGSTTTTANSYDVNVSVAASVATVTITKVGNYTAADAQTLVDGLQYQNSSEDPTGTERHVTMTLIQDDGGTLGGGDDDSDPVPYSTVTLAAVNDAPTLGVTASDPTFTEGGAAVGLYSATNIDLIEGGDKVQTIELTVTGLQNGSDEILVIDGENVALVVGSTTTLANSYDVNVAVVGPTATVTISKIGNFTATEAETLVDGLQYENTSASPLGASRVATIALIQDDGGTLGGGDDDSTPNIASTVTIVSTNGAPTLTATALDPTFTENGSAVGLYSGTTIDLVEAGDKVKTIELTVGTLQNGTDEILVVDGQNITLTTGVTVTATNSYNVNVSAVASVATVTITKTGDIDVLAAETLIDSLQYLNNHDDPGTARTVTITSIQDDGGGTDNSAPNIVSNVTVTPVNDAPTLSSTADDPTFIENGAAVSLFSATVIDLIEAADKVKTIELTLSGLQNGSDEILVVDGENIALVTGATTTLANSYDVNVSVLAGTATVTITKLGDFTAIQAETLVDGLQYANGSEDPLGASRIATITRIQDNGGTAGTGDDDSIPNIASAVSLTATNDSPTLNANGDDPTFTENGSAVGLYSGTTIDLVEAADKVKTIELTVGTLQNGSDEILGVDGQNITLTTGVTVTATNSYNVNVSVAASVATVTITKTGDIDVTAAETLIDSLQYLNNHDDPGTARTVTITSIQDNGGGTDSSTPNIVSNVTVTPVNDAPAGGDETVTTSEDTDYVFKTADFNFTDPVDGTDSLLAVKVTTLASAGTLEVGGFAVIVGQFVTLAEITGGDFTFTPVSGESGSGYASFTFQVQDDGGTANSGVDLDPVANTITIDVDTINDEPSGADKTVTTLEDTDIVFAVSDFGFSDTDGNSLQAVKITTLSGVGTLKLSGSTFAAGTFISVADITTGKLTFTPAGDANGTGHDSFTFQVQDDGGISGGGADLDATPNTITIDVTPVNDASDAADATVTTLEDTDHVFTVAEFGFSDVIDGDGLEAVRITTLTAGGTIKLSGAAVAAGTFITVGDITAGNLTYTPADDANGLPYDSFTFQVRDDGGTTDGGKNRDATPNTITINVTADNDAPTLANHSISIFVDDMLNASSSLFDLLSNDVDGDSLTPLFGIGPSNGTLSPNPDGSFTYTPNAGFIGIDSFQWQADDTTDPSAIATFTIEVKAPVVLITPDPDPDPDPEPDPEPDPDPDPAPDPDPVADPDPVTPPADNSSPPPKRTVDQTIQTLPAEVGELMVSGTFIDYGAVKHGSSRLNQNSQAADKSNQSPIDLHSDDSLDGVLSRMDFVMMSQAGEMWDEMDSHRQLIDSQIQGDFIVVGAAGAAASSFTIGYVAWALRSGFILSGLLAQMPAWQSIDPLLIMQGLSGVQKSETLEEMMDRKAKGLKRGGSGTSVG